MARVLVLGGGFGGLAGAHELRRRLGPDHQVTVVDRNDGFAMGFAKLWDLAGVRPLAEGTRSLRLLANHGIEFVHADIEGIDPERRTVRTSEGELRGDAVLVALGAGASAPHVAWLDGDAAHDLYAAAALPGIHRALDGIDAGRVLVAILGGPFKCPPAPYEAALIVDERLRRRGVRERVEIAVATPQPVTLPVAGPDASQYVATHLGDRDVALLAHHAVADVDGARRVVRFANGAEVDYEILLGVPASAPPAVVTASGLVGPSGWIEPDRATLATAADLVYAVGDCTQIPTAVGQLPKAGVFAAAEAEVAARNIAADLLDGDRATFDGHGYCFLELPGEQVAYVEGNFFAEPSPEVSLTEADHAQFERKQTYERERLTAWLG